MNLNGGITQQEFIPRDAFQQGMMPEQPVSPDMAMGGQPELQQEMQPGMYGEQPEPEYDEINVEREERDLVDKFLQTDNGAEYLGEQMLIAIGQKVCDDFDIDKRSREKWEREYDEALDLVKTIPESKDYPFTNASNVRYPIVMQAAIQFNARSYPSIITNSGIVKGKVIGKDADGRKAKRAMRVSEHMNYQLSEEMGEWESEFDNQLFMTAFLGTTFKKTYYDSASNRNVSELINPYDIVVNYRASSCGTPMRMTHVYDLYPNQIKEKINEGLFLDVGLGYSSQVSGESETSTDKRAEESQSRIQIDDDAPHRILEQHRWLDLDGDGYQEPYIVVVHKETKKVLRIVRRWDATGVIRAEDDSIVKIEQVSYFTKYIFMPSPDGGYYGLGFGSLLASGAETINTIINQQLDAATDMISGGGWISSDLVNGKAGGTMYFEPSQWRMVNMSDDLKKQIMERPTARPSPVLFQMLQFLVNTYERLGSVTDVLTGEQNVSNVPATTTIAMIEQGTKVFSAVYKRIYNSLRSEIKNLFRLNSLYLEDAYYYRVIDEEKIVARDDYDIESCDVVPVCDPNNMNDVLKKVKAEAVLQLKGQPHINPMEVDKIYIEALQVPYGDRIFVEPQPPPPDPQIEIDKQKNEIEAAKVALDREKFEFDKQKKTVDTERTIADTEKLRAETRKILSEIDEQSRAVADLSEKMKSMTELLNRQGETIKQLRQGGRSETNRPQQSNSTGRGIGGMEGAPGNAQGGGGLGAPPARQGYESGAGAQSRPQLSGAQPNQVSGSGGVLSGIKRLFGRDNNA